MQLRRNLSIWAAALNSQAFALLGNPSSHDRGEGMIGDCHLTKEIFYADPQFALAPLKGIPLAEKHVFRKRSEFRIVSSDLICIGLFCVCFEGICVTDANVLEEIWETSSEPVIN